MAAMEPYSPVSTVTASTKSFSPAASPRVPYTFSAAAPVVASPRPLAFEIAAPKPKPSAEKAAKVEKTALADVVKQKVEKVVVQVKDGFVYVYGKVGNVLISMKVAIDGKLEVAKTKALANYNQVKAMIEDKIAVPVKDKYVLVKGKIVKETLVVKGKIITGYDIAKTNVLQKYALVQNKVAALPIPVPVKNTFMYLQAKSGKALVIIQDSCMYIYGKVGDATVAIKVKGIKSYGMAKERGHQIFDKVADSAKLYTLKVKDGLKSVKGKVSTKAGDAIVCIKSTANNGMSAAQAKALAVYNQMKKTVEGLAITGKIKDGVTVINGKLSDMKVYVKEGYVHVSAKLDDKVYYIKTQVVKARGVLKVKVLEAWSGVEALAHYVADVMAGAQDYTKSKLNDKPITASAVGGAMMLGAGGGAAGGVVGGLGGAIAGLPFALITLGLSIPVGAAVGGGAGVCVGAATGGAAGAVGGSVAGYGYGHRAEIKSGMDGVVKQATTSAEQIKGKTKAALNKLGSKSKVA